MGVSMEYVWDLFWDSDLNVRKPIEHSSDAKLAGESDPLGEYSDPSFPFRSERVSSLPWLQSASSRS
ncbi:hypothetical protein JHK82_043241 [Glycine max]|nr:hypothetical protein JHK86_043279 [Glycine max]KAG5106271.1 hypothetical protein JHK82_043241 [Glycine max]